MINRRHRVEFTSQDNSMKCVKCVMRWWLLLWAGALLSICGGFAQGSEVVSFRSQNLPSPAATDVSALATRAVLRAYLAKHPDVVVEPFVMPAIGGSAMDSGPLMAIAAGIPPHVIYVNFRMSSTYLAQGFLEPLEVLLARVLSDDPRVRQIVDGDRWAADPTPQEVAAALEAIRQRVPDPAWPVVYREDESGRSRERHVWAIPTSTLVMGLQYRKDLFVAAGLDPEQPPRTWEELLDYARRLTRPERNQYGLALPGGQTLGWGAYTFLASAGAQAVTQDQDGQWRATYDTREAAVGMAYLWRLVREPFERDGQVIPGAAYIGAGELPLMWQRGQIAMQFDYLDEELVGQLNPQLVGLAPVPVGPGGRGAGEINCKMLGIYSGSSLEQQLAAMEYIWFVTSEEAQRIRTQVYVEHGYGQFVNPYLLERFGYDRVLRQVPRGWRQAFETGMAQGVPEPYGRNTQNIYRHLSLPIHTVLEMDLQHLDEPQRIAAIQQVMADSAREINIRVLGNIPPDQMRTRRLIGGVVIAVVGLVFVGGLVSVWRYFSRVAVASTEKRSWRRDLIGYTLLVPCLALTVLWLYVPLAWGAGISLSDYRIVQESAWVGVDNYANVLFDPRFWASLGRTLYFVALMIVLGFWPPILLAILLDEVPTATLKYLFRTIFYLPAIIVGVVIMFMWKQFYDPSPHGMLNQVILSLNHVPAVPATLLKWVMLALWLSFTGMLVMLPWRLTEATWGLRAFLFVLGAVFVGLTLGGLYWAGPANAAAALVGRFELEPLRWIASPQLAMLCTVLPLVWAGAGPGCLLYLAGLKTIQNELYEAADIDGANAWQKLFYITLPRLKYLITIQFIAAVIGAFKGGTDYILALTGGGPGEATHILGLEIFTRTFMELQFGAGAAMAWLLGGLLIAFTAWQLKMLSGAEFKSATRT